MTPDGNVPQAAGVLAPGNQRSSRSLTAAERAASDAVDAAWAIDALVRLVQTKSITGDEGDVQDLAAELLADAGLTVERLEPDPAAARRDPEWRGGGKHGEEGTGEPED